MAHLSLSLLGGFQATAAGRSITTFESDRVRALLAYLAVEATRPHRCEALAALLWFSPDGSMLLAGCVCGNISLANLEDLAVTCCVGVDPIGMHVARFAGAGQCLVGGNGGQLSIWQARDDGMLTCRWQLEAHNGMIMDVRAHPRDPICVSVGQDSRVRLWHVETGECLRTWHTPRPYEGASIQGVRGLSHAERSNLLALDAVEEER